MYNIYTQKAPGLRPSATAARCARCARDLLRIYIIHIYTDILLILYIIGIIPSGRFSEFENEAFLLYCPQ